jgi:hypothetical protein
MKYKYVQFEEVFIILMLFTPLVFAEPNSIINGSFEHYDVNTVLEFNTPAGWNIDGHYTAIVDHLTPRSPRWKLKTNLLPFDGNYFLLLSTGTENKLPRDPNQANVWQTITVNAGDKLTGVYFFGTLDYNTFNDWAEIKLVPMDSNLSILMLVSVNVLKVGSWYPNETGSMSGWKRFEHTFTSGEAGIYTLIIRVCDYKDYLVDSFFAVDSLVLCHNPAQTGDFSCDCTVNFDDFVYFAHDWRCNCKNPKVHNDYQSDPNYYNDPNSYCLLGTDLNNDGMVDINDLQILSEHWLEGIKE